MGQSLAAGEQSLPIVTTENAKSWNFKFNLGTHTWNNNNHPDAPYLREPYDFNFVPLTANRRIDEGETIANGLCDHFSENTNTNRSLLFSYAGQGGRYLRELDKQHDDAKDERAGKRQSKGGHYKTSIEDIVRAQNKTNNSGCNYDVLAITWMQGESSGSGKINRWDDALPREKFLNVYKEDLINLKNDYDSDISEILGKEVRLPFFTYQTGGTMAGTAQLMASDETEDMYMVGPTYMMPNAENTYYDYKDKNYHGDGIHLTADAERWFGEQFGKVLKRVIIDKEEWQPLRPKSAYIKNAKNEILVNFHVPRPPLVLDTIFLPKQGNAYGFRVSDVDGKNIPIVSTEVVNGNTIKIVTQDDITKQALVSYATRTYVDEVSSVIIEIEEKPENEHGHKELNIVFEGDIVNEFNTLMDEGVFYLLNRVNEPSENTNIIIRQVYLDASKNTVLVGEVDDLRKNIPFKIGQRCYVARRYTFGNLRDSDPEKSLYTFSDDSYGTRAGSNYPLYNWSVSFQDLEIKED